MCHRHLTPSDSKIHAWTGILPRKGKHEHLSPTPAGPRAAEDVRTRSEDAFGSLCALPTGSLCACATPRGTEGRAPAVLQEGSDAAPVQRAGTSTSHVCTARDSLVCRLPALEVRVSHSFLLTQTRVSPLLTVRVPAGEGPRLFLRVLHVRGTPNPHDAPRALHGV